jgi:F0F1-type ATP synthase assembly protein I
MDNSNKKPSMWNSEYIKVFTNISAWIVGPVLVSIFIGKYLDKKFGTAPWILGVSLALSFTISMIAIVKIASKYSKEVDKKDDGK